jgi:hypothetical protein
MHRRPSQPRRPKRSRRRKSPVVTAHAFIIALTTAGLALSAGCFIPVDMSDPEETGNPDRTTAAMSATMDAGESSDTGSETTDGGSEGESTGESEDGSGGAEPWIQEIVVSHCLRAAECVTGFDAVTCETAWATELENLQLLCGGMPDAVAVTACAADATTAGCDVADACGFTVPDSCADVFVGCGAWIACAAP